MNNILEIQLSEIVGGTIDLSPVDGNEICEYFLKRLKDILMDIFVDEDYLKEEMKMLGRTLPAEGIRNFLIETALSLICTLKMMGMQEEVSHLLHKWRKDAFFRVS